MRLQPARSWNGKALDAIPKSTAFGSASTRPQGARETDKAIFAALNGRALLVATKTDLLTEEGIDRLGATLKEFAPDNRIVLHSTRTCGLAKLGRLTSAVAMANASPGDDYAKELLAELAEEAAREGKESEASDNEFTLKDYLRIQANRMRAQAEKDADRLVYWAAGRAFAIAFVPFAPNGHCSAGCQRGLHDSPDRQKLRL